MFYLETKRGSELFHRAIQVALGELYTGVFCVRLRRRLVSEDVIKYLLGTYRRPMSCGKNSMPLGNQSTIASGVCP